MISQPSCLIHPSPFGLSHNAGERQGDALDRPAAHRRLTFTLKVNLESPIQQSPKRKGLDCGRKLQAQGNQAYSTWKSPWPPQCYPCTPAHPPDCYRNQPLSSSFLDQSSHHGCAEHLYSSPTRPTDDKPFTVVKIS